MDIFALPVILELPVATPLVLAFAFILLVVGNKLLFPSKGSSKACTRPCKSTSVSEDCPYQYLLKIYGKYHFAGFVAKLAPGLESSDPKKWGMILEIMDHIHFCAILVDDIADNSDFRKGLPTAHRIFGPSETTNRAYLSLARVFNKAMREQPQLAQPLLQNFEEILEGQDMSLVWRRDGIRSLPLRHEDRINIYRRSAYLKTGALFRLVGQLVSGDHSNDDLMTRVGWYCHLQNDCKNMYSSEYVEAKGALAEDLRNGEFSYPTILALHHPKGDLVTKALESGTERDITKALAVIQSDVVRDVCFQELKQVGSTIQDFVEVWGRNEKYDGH